MSLIISPGETDASLRLVEFILVSTDGISPVTNKGGEQPSISINGGVFTTDGISVLTNVESNRYVATLDTDILTENSTIRSRFKDTDTAECWGETVQVKYVRDPFTVDLDTYTEGTAGFVINDLYSGVVDLLSRVGSFSGSGVDTLKDFLLAIARNDVPSGMGGTYNPTSDSLQALRDVIGSGVSPVDTYRVSISSTVSGMILMVRDLIGDRENRSNVFNIRCDGYGVTAATLSISNGVLSTSLTGGTTAELDIDLTTYDTIYDLAEYLSTVDGYSVEMTAKDGSQSPLHLVPVNSINIMREARIQTRYWFSDQVIYSWLSDACNRLLPDYALDSLPEDETLLVEYKAAMTGCTILMAKGAKYVPISLEGFSSNKGATVDSYARLWAMLRDQMNELGASLVKGNMVHKSDRTGRLSPSAKVEQVIPVKLTVDSYDDTTATLSWTQNRNEDFFAYEVYRKEGSGAYELLYTIEDIHHNYYTDDTLSPQTSYSFKIRNVVSLEVSRVRQLPYIPTDVGRLYKDSNEVTITTLGA